MIKLSKQSKPQTVKYSDHRTDSAAREAAMGASTTLVIIFITVTITLKFRLILEICKTHLCYKTSTTLEARIN